MMKRENFVNIKFRLKKIMHTHTYIHIQLKFGIFGGEECLIPEIERWSEKQIVACN